MYHDGTHLSIFIVKNITTEINITIVLPEAKVFLCYKVNQILSYLNSCIFDIELEIRCIISIYHICLDLLTFRKMRNIGMFGLI